MTAIQVADRGGATAVSIDVGEMRICNLHHPPEKLKEIFDKIPDFEFRDEDLMLCTAPKTGTNWLFEMLTMIANRSADSVRSNKVFTELEFNTQEDINAKTSPRIINSHNPPRFLPIKNMQKKQIKTVLCLRNPKDVAVSYYNHMKGMNYAHYDGKWENWLPVYMDGQYDFGRYSDYLLEWEDTIQNGPGFPLHIMYFEDLKQDGPKELDGLLRFLGVEIEESLKKRIMENCGFKTMMNKPMPEEMKKLYYKNGFNFYRKGQVGDWKNWFTVAQNEEFDYIWSERMKESKLFHFRYVL